jgi:hypothetical protein
LGHPSAASLSNLFSRFHIPCTNKSVSPSVSEVCQKGKHIPFPFHNSRTFTYFPFQIIHYDIWMSPVESFTGFKYYLIIIDDYSHYIWTFPLCRKSEVFATLCSFYRYVLNQFCLSIQCIQCVNGKEFDNNDVHSFLSTSDIVFHLSCPHTSPQNGKAECAIHSINDVMRTLLFQSHLKPSYWVDALHTTTYLYNRHPSPPLHLLTPYKSLFLQRPDYSHLCTFGCLCFPNLSATTPHKLAPRSAPCVFIGYPSEHKGYRCWIYHRTK